jgi:hypothetical protein
MTHTHNFPFLPAALAAGTAGAALRFLLYRFGPDDRGLLPRFHPLHLLCLALALGLAMILFIGLKKHPLDKTTAGMPFTPLALPELVAALGLLLSCGLRLLEEMPLIDGRPDVLRIALPFLFAVCFLALVILALLGKRPHYLVYTILCAGFLLDMLVRYREWSGTPQIPDYCFQVGANIFLTLSAYFRTALDTGIDSEGKCRFCNCMALCLCLMSAVGPDSQGFYLGCGCWMLAELAARRSRTEVMDPTAE